MVIEKSGLAHAAAGRATFATHMLDLARIRSEPEVVAAALSKRVEVDFAALLQSDTERRQLVTRADALKAERNFASHAIAEAKASGGDATAAIAQMREVAEQIKELDRQAGDLEQRIRSELEVLARQQRWQPVIASIDFEFEPMRVHGDRGALREHGRPLPHK